jgi:hypothetical protein
MNTFMPYLETFTHIDEWNDMVDDSTLFEEIEADADMPAPDDLDKSAYAYEIEMVQDEDDDFFIG